MMGSRIPSSRWESASALHLAANSEPSSSRGMNPREKEFCRPRVRVPAMSPMSMSMTPSGTSPWYPPSFRMSESATGYG